MSESEYTASLSKETLVKYRDQCMELASKAETRGAMNLAEHMMKTAEMYDKAIESRDTNGRPDPEMKYA